MKAINLQTEYLTNPIGIEVQSPRFTWTCYKGQIQQKFQIIIVNDEGKIYDDSGIIESSLMHYTYKGKSLNSRDLLFWNVEIWDETGISEKSDQAFFEIGLIHATDWKAKWISGIDTDTEERLPADYYKKTFKANQHIKKARLYITAQGIYEAYINGEVVTDFLLAPGVTQYDKRLYYQTYDVTKYIENDNEINIIVGDGWYKGKLGCDSDECLFGKQTKIFAQLEITYLDDTQDIIKTDESFTWSNDGALGYNDIKDGIIYDARKTPTYKKHAIEIDLNLIPKASLGPKLMHIDTLEPTLLVSPSGAKILDFGQNFAGSIAFDLKGTKGDTLSLKCFEVLDHGKYCDKTFRTLPERGKSINQEIRYTFSGHLDSYKPNFHYFGFRYALVEGLDDLNPKDFKGYVISSDLPYKTTFDSSNEMLNQFVKNTIWSLKSNFFDIPTDCPHREKAGWTGDAQIIAKTATYLTAPISFFRKWLLDVKDCQREDGRVHNIAPKINKAGMTDMLHGSVGWADAAVIIPYTLWKTYGDDRLIYENIELMLKWKDYVINLAKDKSVYESDSKNSLKPMYESTKPKSSAWNQYLIESGFHWGEWQEPLDVMGNQDIKTILTQPKREEATAYLHFSMEMLAEMLSHIGNHKEADICRKYAHGAKKAYQTHFIKNEDIHTNRQAKLVRPLALGLINGQTKINVAKRLNEVAIQRNYKVGTGFLSTPFLCPTLAHNGFVKTAYQTLLNTDSPGWLSMVKQGATTVWEGYDGFDQNNTPFNISMNHYALGAVCAFLFEDVLGISIMKSNTFRIQPLPHELLEYANGTYDSIYGIVKVNWKHIGKKISYEIHLPANTNGVFISPNDEQFKLSSGMNNFNI